METEQTTLEEKQQAIARIAQLRSLPPRAKAERSERLVREFFAGTDGLCYCSWSGGLDSRVMLHIIRKIYGLGSIPAVFIDTGLEYPEVKECALRHADVVLRPARTFAEVVRTCGFPVVSKKVAQYVGEVQSAYRHGNRDSATVRLRMTGFTGCDVYSEMGKIPKKWQCLCDAPFMVSDKCCKHLKKGPAKAFEKSSGRKPMIGIKIEDSKQRAQTFFNKHGGHCNAFGERSSSWPLAIWNDSDIWAYIREHNLDYPNLYDHGATGTGCMFCMFGIAMEKGENRFQRMYRTHPLQWKYCMDKIGVRDVMAFIGLPVEPTEDLFEKE